MICGYISIFIEIKSNTRTQGSGKYRIQTHRNVGILPQIYVKERQTDCPTIRQNTAKCIGKFTLQ
jgi:hypothetical protein